MNRPAAGHPPQALAHDQISRKRELTASAMVCPAAGCAGRLLITPTGCLVCEHGCGRLLSPLDVGIKCLSIASLKAAWPDRVIEPSEERQKAEREEANKKARFYRHR